MDVLGSQQFFGYKKQLDLIKKRVLDLKEGYRQNLALLGPRYIGKSALLKKFIEELSEANIVPLYIDLEHKDLRHFFKQVVGRLLHYFAESQNLPSLDYCSASLERAASHLPVTIRMVKKIESLLSYRKDYEAYKDILTIPHVFAKETNTFCVLFLDEFQNLDDWNVEKVFAELSKSIMTQKQCLYVITSSYPNLARRILSEKFSLLFGDFETVRVEPLDCKSSNDFIDQCLKDFKMKDELRKFLVDFTGGYALYLRLITQELSRQCVAHHQTEIFSPILSNSIEDLLFAPWGILNRHFDALLSEVCCERNNALVIEMLLTLTQGKIRIRDLAHIINAKQSHVSSKLSRLVEQEVVDKNGNFYFIKDKLFKFWLKFVYSSRWESVQFDGEESLAAYRQTFSSIIEKFLKHSRKDFSARMIDLLYSFEPEALTINGRKYKLPLFKEMVSTKIRRTAGGQMDFIRATTADGSWVIVADENPLAETDIGVIISEAKKFKRKPERCILITPRSMDENARLRALQERMWIWSEDELGVLLNLFDKHYIL